MAWAIDKCDACESPLVVIHMFHADKDSALAVYIIIENSLTHMHMQIACTYGSIA